MSKTVMGVDFGASEVTFAVCDPGAIRRLEVEPLPDNLLRDRRVVSPEAMSDFLRQTAAKHHLNVRSCAVSLPPTVAFTRRTTMPAMTVDQLRLNLPYEFRDFISQEKDKYVYDYALLQMDRDEAGKPVQLELMAAAALKADLRAYIEIFRQAGFRLVIAAPEEFAWSNLIRRYEQVHPDHAGQEHCIIDLGHTATRVFIFTGPRFEVTRVLEYGGAMIDAAIAEEFHVDEHLARTYKLTDYEGALNRNVSQNIYGTLSVEIMRAVNFYGYNTPGSALRTAWVCGGGVRNTPLMAQLSQTLNLELLPISGLLPPGCEEDENRIFSPTAVGITQQ